MAYSIKFYDDERAAAMRHINQLDDYPEFKESVRLCRLLLPLVTGHPQGTPAGSWSDQTYRSASSVSANLAEACGRAQRSQVIQFFRIGRGSAFETVSHLSLCPIPDTDLNDIRKGYVNLIELIDQSLIRLIDNQAPF